MAHQASHYTEQHVNRQIYADGLLVIDKYILSRIYTVLM